MIKLLNRISLILYTSSNNIMLFLMNTVANIFQSCLNKLNKPCVDKTKPKSFIVKNNF